MEEVIKRSKRRRTYWSFDPRATIYTDFSHKYVSYLLPALLEAATIRKNAEIEKMVRFEIDMALVLSANEFKWSRALKHELEEGIKPTKSHSSNVKLNSHYGGYMFERLDGLRASYLAIPRPLVVVKATRPNDQRVLSQRTSGFHKKNVVSREGELGCRVRVLRRILPGGGEMGVFELLSEVESYVICLQLQVDILRSLLDAH